MKEGLITDTKGKRTRSLDGFMTLYALGLLIFVCNTLYEYQSHMKMVSDFSEQLETLEKRVDEENALIRNKKYGCHQLENYRFCFYENDDGSARVLLGDQT